MVVVIITSILNVLLFVAHTGSNTIEQGAQQRICDSVWLQ